MKRWRHGTCDGGPCHGGKIADVTDTVRLCYELAKPNRAFPAVQATTQPGFSFGVYAFDHQARIWRWNPGVDNR